MEHCQRQYVRSVMQKKVLITGASGLIGKRLRELLLSKGYEVNTIGRKPASARKKSNAFYWDVEAMTMDEKALEGVSAIVHLAGAGVADARWTSRRKKEIMDSRVQSTQLLFQALSKIPHKVEAVVSASAVGIYGDCGAEVVTETHKPANTFLADVCVQWEKEVKQFSTLGIREVRNRIGIVLAKDGGALPELSKSLAFGVAGYFTKSPLFYPWIHIDDVCGIFIHAIEDNQLKGAYNVCAPEPLELKDLMQAIITGSGKKALLLPAPAFALRLAMGEMAEMLLSSQRCTAAKVLKSGYKFMYEDAAKAVEMA